MTKFYAPVLADSSHANCPLKLVNSICILFSDCMSLLGSVGLPNVHWLYQTLEMEARIAKYGNLNVVHKRADLVKKRFENLHEHYLQLSDLPGKYFKIHCDEFKFNGFSSVTCHCKYLNTI